MNTRSDGAGRQGWSPASLLATFGSPAGKSAVRRLVPADRRARANVIGGVGTLAGVLVLLPALRRPPEPGGGDVSAEIDSTRDHLDAVGE